ncbi:hypothetical protein CC1G_12913 [Coprinopsis cinerea okayama7|uniref:Uncharacterized protein n=1 Tax=Coprinopsis cinerea (strain Okayama-7 / 130 / ATCC MYA-4618 / FGSC 9003) TaxID=240176 RepID=A8P9L5_COPC7|nr:hypothetical protein CC1G_12913 [Coprinopsis cinerea okayama7\|eukprot:XP_001839796.1 hypothetical protein CC1G_12913 [Coprinopsis cinerea okayama7\
MLTNISVCKDFYAAWQELPPEVQDQILEYLTFRELEAISRTPAFRDDSLEEPPTIVASNVLAARSRKVVVARAKAYLQDFSLPFGPTMEAMRQFSTLWSGSAVLAVGQPVSWQVGDLDFYSPKPYAPLFIEFLQDNGYHYPTSPSEREISPDNTEEPTLGAPQGHHSRPSHIHYLQRASGVPAGSVVSIVEEGDTHHHDFAGPYIHNQGIDAVYSLYNREGKKVNVIQSSTSTAWTPILFFHSTLVMNTINHNGLISLYGEMTFRAQAGLQNYGGQLDPYMEMALDKYRSRGFDIYAACGDFGCPCTTNVHGGYGALCQSAHRFLGDKDTLLMTFDGTRMDLPDTTKWRLGGNYEVIDGLYIEQFPRVEIQEHVVRMYSRGFSPRFAYAMCPVH